VLYEYIIYITLHNINNILITRASLMESKLDEVLIVNKPYIVL